MRSVPSTLPWLLLMLLAMGACRFQWTRDRFWVRERQPVAQPPFPGNVEPVLAEWQRCPNGTHYITKRHAQSFPFPHVIGCCPEEQQGVYVAGQDRIAGCCPNDQVGGYRVGSTHPRFLGCADDICQIGPHVVCPSGRGYCPGELGRPGRCMPHAGDPCDRAAYCAGRNLTRTNIASDSPLDFDHPVLARWHRWRWYRFEDRLYATDDDVDGDFQGPLLTPPLHICNGTGSVCPAGDVCATVPFETTDANGTVVDSEPLETHCCPANHQVCETPPSPAIASVNETANLTSIAVFGDFLGCANLARNETCCGRTVCPAQHKCCRMSVSQPDNENVAPGSAQSVFCCPEQMQCCYGNPATRHAPPSPTETGPIWGYCGLTINNVTCAMDRMRASEYYPIARNRHQLSTVL